jgi:hypothetical protein
MLAPNEVIDKARTYLGEVVPEFAALEPKVEEMVRVPNSSEWKVTFYALKGVEKTDATSLADLLRWRRIEKVVSVGADDGALIAVRNPPPF